MKRSGEVGRPLKAVVAFALAVHAVCGVCVCERADIEVGPDGVRCAQVGDVVFADAFADAKAWSLVKNYENRLRLAFGARKRAGTSCLVVSGPGEKPLGDTAWNVQTAPLRLAKKGARYRFSFGVATQNPIHVGSSDTEGWWTSVRWYDASGAQTNVQRVSWIAAANPYGEVVAEGDIPAWADRFSVQVGYDIPNVACGQRVEISDVKLVVLDPDVRRAPQASFCSDPRANGFVSWQAEVPAGCAVRFQCVTADDMAELATKPFVGPDGTAATYYERPFAPKGGAWMRYKAVLFSDGRATPLLKMVKVGPDEHRGWTLEGDGRAPYVRLLTPSPTLDRAARLKLSVEDDSAIMWKDLKVEVDGVDLTSRFRRDGNVLELAGTCGPWAEGLHAVDVTAGDWYGNTRVAHKRFFVGEAPRTPRVTLRDDGITLIDGEPFFPVGIYGVMRRAFNTYDFDRAFGDLRRAGFNFAHSYSSPHEKEFLDAAWKHGIRIWNVARLPDATFLAERNHPAILAWYLGDDTSTFETPEELRDYHDAVKAVDPTRITTQADAVGASEGAFSHYHDYVAGTDNFLAEIYPVHTSDAAARRECVAKVIRDMKRVRSDVREAGLKEPRSCWPIIQYFKGWGWARFPAKDELDAMSFASIIHGAHGITWYTYGGTVEPENKKFNYGVTTSRERWTNMTNLVARIRSLESVLVERTGAQPPAPEIVKGPKVDALGNESISILLKRHAGKDYLLAVNSTPEPVVARMRPEGAREGAVLWENRRVACAQGILEDAFAPFAVHVYVFDR